MQAQPRFDWRSAGQLAVSLAGIVLGLAAAGVLALTTLLPWLEGETPGGQQAIGMMTLAWIGLLLAGLSLPSAVLALRRLMGRAPVMRNGQRSLKIASLLLLVWPLALLLAKSAVNSTMAWLFLPPLLILVMGIPTFWLTSAARAGLPAESLQRGWGVASFGAVVGPALIVLLEAALLVMALVAVGVWLSGQPGLLPELQRLAETFTLQSDPARLMELLQPYLERPGMLAAGLAFVAVLVPLIEEAFKPLAAWLLAGRWLTPASGFSAGVLGGGMFALVESLGYLAGAPTEGFVGFALARSGTLLLHIATAGLVGWGVGSALSEGRYLRLALTYLGAVLLHGAWNVVGILPALAELPGLTGPWQAALEVFPYALGGLCVLLAAILILLNRHLCKPVIAVPGREVPVETLP
jgi:hypothetical protein